MTPVLGSLQQLLLPPDVQLTPAVRARWVTIGAAAAGGIGFAAIAGAMHAAAGRIPWPRPTLEALRIAVPIAAAVCTGAGLLWVLRPRVRRRSLVGTWAGVLVALVSHPLAWGIALWASGDAGASGGVLGASLASLRAVGWVTVPLCAAGGYWVGRRFTGAICP